MDVTLRFYLLTPLFVVLASGRAAGQDRWQRVEVFAGAGAARVGGDEGSLGNGACLVAGFGFRFAARASVEVDLMRAQHERNIAGGPLEGTATGVFGDVVYRFAEGRTQVFVMGSAGLLSSKTTHTYSAGWWHGHHLQVRGQQLRVGRGSRREGIPETTTLATTTVPHGL